MANEKRLICNCPSIEDCEAFGSDLRCFPWCDYLKELEDEDEKQEANN